MRRGGHHRPWLPRGTQRCVAAAPRASVVASSAPTSTRRAARVAVAVTQSKKSKKRGREHSHRASATGVTWTWTCAFQKDASHSCQ